MSGDNFELARADFATSRLAIEALTGKGSAQSQILIAASAGKNTLFEELGAFIDVSRTSAPYGLDEDLRDSLLGNTRRDVATLHTLCEFLLLELHSAKKSQVRLMLISGTTLVLSVFSTVWQLV